jgi:Na+/H+ antiporter NhaD/arsenite permease-like protein
VHYSACCLRLTRLIAAPGAGSTTAPALTPFGAAALIVTRALANKAAEWAEIILLRLDGVASKPQPRG